MKSPKSKRYGRRKPDIKSIFDIVPQAGQFRDPFKGVKPLDEETRKIIGKTLTTQ